jgi:formamidopyrimidine-DNA glycosylase
MPELPDLVYLEKKLSSYLSGQTIQSVDLKEPIVLRQLVKGDFAERLAGKQFLNVRRHGPFMIFDLSDALSLVIHPMLAGKFHYSAEHNRKGRGLCFTLKLENNEAFSYSDDKKMGKVYLVEEKGKKQIPMFANQGRNIMDTSFDQGFFLSLIKGQRKQVRVFLMDQTKLSAIGNAYADEILFDAGIHPKTLCSQLSDQEKAGLFKSIKGVMRWGIEQVDAARQPIDVKVRNHVKVRNRKDQPCPRCGTTIRRAGVLGYDAFFCPKCQPIRRSQFIEWK